MAYTQRYSNGSISIRLNAGQEEGKTVYKTTTLTKVAPGDTTTNGYFGNILEKLTPCLAYPVSSITRRANYSLEASE